MKQFTVEDDKQKSNLCKHNAQQKHHTLFTVLHTLTKKLKPVTMLPSIFKELKSFRL